MSSSYPEIRPSSYSAVCFFFNFCVGFFECAPASAGVTPYLIPKGRLTLSDGRSAIGITRPSAADRGKREP